MAIEARTGINKQVNKYKQTNIYYQDRELVLTRKGVQGNLLGCWKYSVS